MFVAVARVDYEGERIIGVFASQELAIAGIEVFRVDDGIVAPADAVYDEYRVYDFPLDVVVPCTERLEPVYVVRTPVPAVTIDFD